MVDGLAAEVSHLADNGGTILVDQHHVQTQALCLLPGLRGSVDPDDPTHVVFEFDQSAGLDLLVMELIFLLEEAAHR